MPVDYSTWLPKQQAADALQCATKTLEQLSKSGKLQTAMYKRPQGGPAIRVYHPDDVERLRKERNPEANPFVLPAELKSVTALQIPRTEAIQAQATALGYFDALWMDLRERYRDEAVPLREKIFLTLPEAVQLTGLPDAVIRRMIHNPANLRQQELSDNAELTGQGWRVRRKDLEAL